MKLASRHKRRLIPSGIDWIGEVPEGWHHLAMKRVTRIINGREIENELEEHDAGAIPVYGSGGVFKFTDKVLYDGEAVLFGRKGTIGKPIYVNDSFWVVDTMYLSHYDQDEMCARYAYYSFSVFDWKLYTTQTALPSVVASEALSHHFPIPPLPEQREIAAKLDEVCGKIDGLAAKIKKEIEKLEEYRKALITKCVTKGLNKKAKFRPSGVEWIGDVPEGWKVERVKYHYDFTTGFTPPTSDESLYPDDGDTWVTIADLKGEVVSESTSHIDHEYALMHFGDMTKAGSLMYSFKLSVGTTAIAGKDLFTNEAIASFEPADGISIPFLKYSSSLIANNAKKNIYNAYLLNRQLIRDAPIVFPSIPEQREIAAYLDKKCGAIDGVLAKRRKQLEGLAEYRKSVIYSYVTGKKEVSL